MKNHIRHVSGLLAVLLVLALLCGCAQWAKIPAPVIQLDEVPAYTGEPAIEINGNVPFFTDEELTEKAFETYSPLDRLGRCGTAYANLCPELMPTEKRGEIGMVKPAGWHTVRYDDLVDGKYLYNRCHLIGFQLAGENANEQNLITGTRYFNVEGMLPYEDEAADYVKKTENHVLYRVTPVYEGDDLVARGVLMEARSVEDDGLSFCVYVYNVQPGVEIDYRTGESRREGEAAPEPEKAVTYIINKNTKKFHLPDCPSVQETKPQNRESFTGTREELIARGYEPCGRCRP